MSGFTNLKSLWENKGKQQLETLPNKAIPQKLKPFQIKEESENGSLKTPIMTPIVSRQSVAALKSNLEGKIKFGVISPYSPQSNYSEKQGSDKSQQHNQSTQTIENAQSREIQSKMPDFKQTKAGLQKMFEKRSATSKQQQRKDQDTIVSELETTSPEHRTDEIINRVFSQKQVNSSMPSFLPMKTAASIDMGRVSFLNKEEEAKNLGLRWQKKEKKSLAGFDDV